MSRIFNENTRVQVPAAVHLCRLGYLYYGAIAPEEFDASTNILTRKCAAALVRLNPGMAAFTKDIESINAESAVLDKEIAAALKKLEFAEWVLGETGK